MTPDTRAGDFVAGTRKIVQILRYGPRELALALLGFLFLGAIPLLPKLAELLPFLTPALPWVTGVLVVLGLFLLGFAAWGIWKKAVAPLPEAKPKPAAIKGPAPFGPQDAELFARLGRNDDLNKLRDWILDDQKPLVALMGESGVGKTSLLRAGLAHHLQDDRIPVLYWEAVPTEPEAKLLHAVRVGWEDEEKAPKTFGNLASAVASGRRVVVIDQAEQLSPDGHPRIFELLRQVAAGDPPYRATWVVAFRREFLPVWRDFELNLPEAVQRRMETLSLQRFSPKAAEKVIAVLAEEGSLPVDQKLVEELVEGVTVDGKVSPADIGISLLVLSELAGGRPALSLDDFRESGGPAGLLTRYLEKLLELFPEAERPEVLRGLLALVDLEKDQRLAEGRTLVEVEESVKPASPPRFEAALRFLASGKARVLEELPGQPAGYRLVHERLIPAIRKLTGVILAEAERASLALERGYRVWAQDRQSRFLLHRKDLDEVRRFKNQFRWGKEEADKREFVRLSTRREAWRRLAAVAAVLAVGFLVNGLISYSEKREHQSLLKSWGLPSDLYGHVDQLEELTLPGTVTRLEWLARARRLKVLTVEDGLLASLEGLPAGLQTLRVGDSRLADLHGIPASLVVLSLGSSRIERVEALPADLRSLDLDLTSGIRWSPDVLPRSLVDLSLSLPYIGIVPDFRVFDKLQSLSLDSQRHETISLRDRLPEGLRSLELRTVEIKSFEEMPRNLRALSFFSIDPPPSLAGLPSTLERLEFNAGDDSPYEEIDLRMLESVELPTLRSLTLYFELIYDEVLDLAPINIPSSVTSLTVICSNEFFLRGLPQGLQSLTISADLVFLDESLPPGLRTLEVPDMISVKSQGAVSQFIAGTSSTSDILGAIAKESRIVHLPPTLVSFRVDRQRSMYPMLGFDSTDLVQLPVGLRILNLSDPTLSELPVAFGRLDKLTHLSLRGTRVRSLPASLESLVHLDITSTRIQTLAGLPSQLKSLRLGTNQVKALRSLPSGVTALHFHGDAIPVR